MIESAWLWVIAAVVLALVEVLLPGFVLLGFAIGAVAVAVGLWLHLLGSSVALMLLVWALASGAAWWVLRQSFALPGERPKIWHRDINEN
jgi:membrane protein implicated in regulation of membrane protease activity